MTTSDPSSPGGATPQPDDNELEKVLGAAAEAGVKNQDSGDIAADDAGASKMALEVDRRGKLPTSHPPGEGDD